MSFRVVPPTGPREPIIAHVPHASTAIPDDQRREILLDDADLQRELVRMTDWHTDRLFEGMGGLGATLFVNELSRLVVDPERLVDDAREPNAKLGHGAVYTRTTDGAELRNIDSQRRQALIDRLYAPYHAGLTELVAGVLDEFDRCLILDCHSFSTRPLPSEQYQSADRPDICIGTDRFHTPPALATSLKVAFVAEGFHVQRNRPFAGALVPMRYYGTDPRVTSVMVEVRRGLYCNEATGQPLPQLGPVKRAIERAVSAAL